MISETCHKYFIKMQRINSKNGKGDLASDNALSYLGLELETLT